MCADSYQQWPTDVIELGGEVAAGLSLENSWDAAAAIRDRFQHADRTGGD